MAEALHQRDPRPQRRQPHQDGQGPGRRPPHHLPPPGAHGGSTARRDLASRAGDRGRRVTGLSRTDSGIHRNRQPNRGNQGWILGGLPLAVSVIGLVCLLEGCLVPQSIDPKETAQHLPPRIKLDSIPVELLPPVLPLFRQGSADLARNPPCHCWLELRVPQVAIDDPTATLLMKWFVDYDTAVPTSTRPAMPAET